LRFIPEELDVTLSHLLLAALAALPGPSSPRNGAIGGIVVNATDHAAVGGAKVILRARLEGDFVPIAETVASPEGKFLFRGLFVGPYYEYLPGANHQGIHYPGPRVRLTAGRPRAMVELKVCDAVSDPNPLVIRRYDIVVRPEPGAIHVTESMLVDNPTTTCYVGKPAAGDQTKDAEPVTLAMAVPSDFVSVTFEKEFFGRRFSVRDGKLVTEVPWTPGQRELKFTYVLSNEQEYRLWERRLDLPCSEVRLRVHSDTPGAVSCNLAKVRGPSDAKGEIVFQSQGQLLPAGYVLRLELGHLPVPWMAYGRWAAVGVLGALVAGGSVLMVVRRRRGKGQPPEATAPEPESPAGPAFQRRRKSTRRNRKRNTSSRRAA
jgi:hypothetical protein